MKGLKAPATQITSCTPQVAVFVPVLVLCGPDLRLQKVRSHFGVLVDTQAVLDEPPAAVNDLRAGLDPRGLAAVGDLVLYNLNISRSQPFPHTFAFDPLLLMNHSVVQYTLHFSLVTLGQVSMEDDFSMLQPVLGQRLPFHLPNSARSRCSANRAHRFQSMKD